MTTKYTPGPWLVDGAGTKAMVRGADLTIVAVRHRLIGPTHEANARLIAAAPELLEALQGAIKAWDAVYPSMKFDGDVETLEDFEFGEFQKARAAIAKATGEQE